MATHIISFALQYSDDVTPEKARADIREWARVSARTAQSPDVAHVIISDVTTIPGPEEQSQNKS